MTKHETKQLATTIAHGAILGKDYMARAISGMIRAATSKTQKELLAVAVEHGLLDNPEFIV